MDADKQFSDETIPWAEDMLLAHPVARTHFQGEIYGLDGKRLAGLLYKRAGSNLLTLSEATAARLFMAPDGAVVSALKCTDKADAPAGLEVQSASELFFPGERGSLIAYRDDGDTGIGGEALHVHRMMLATDAPARMGTVAFGLMAVTAYRLGFSHITLFAAGRGPLLRDVPGAFVGYCVWPKFGFDAAVVPVELDRFPLARLRGASSVQDVIAADPEWWECHGSARAMRFDLRPRSRSWSILLNYLYNALLEDVP